MTTMITKRGIPAAIMRKAAAAEIAAAPAEAAVASRSLPDAMWARPAEPITREPSTMALSSILPTIGGEPLEFVCGAGQMIRGFDAAVADMEVGQVVDIHLMPEEAYGMPNPDAIFTLEIAQLPGSEELEVGQGVYLTNQFGQPFPVKVTAKDEKTITFDANHEMAGKELNFKIELVEVK